MDVGSPDNQGDAAQGDATPSEPPIADATPTPPGHATVDGGLPTPDGSANHAARPHRERHPPDKFDPAALAAKYVATPAVTGTGHLGMGDIAGVDPELLYVNLEGMGDRMANLAMSAVDNWLRLLLP